jgi:hypothetical protein
MAAGAHDRINKAENDLTNSIAKILGFVPMLSLP